MKKKDQFNEDMAALCEKIGGKNCEGAKQYRAKNRQMEKRRRKSHRANINET